MRLSLTSYGLLSRYGVVAEGLVLERIPLPAMNIHKQMYN